MYRQSTVVVMMLRKWRNVLAAYSSWMFMNTVLVPVPIIFSHAISRDTLARLTQRPLLEQQEHVKHRTT